MRCLKNKNKGEPKMVNLKEIISPKHGIMHVAVTGEKEVLYSFQDICKLFNINVHQTRTKLDGSGLIEVPIQVSKRKVKKVYIDQNNLEICLRESNETNADGIYAWLNETKNRLLITVGGYNVDDLQNPEVATKVLHRLKELETIVAVQDVKIEEDTIKVKMVDKLYGNKAPIDFSQIESVIKYKGVSQQSILDDLRSNGVFNAQNVPNQKYIDSKHFRLVTITTTFQASETVITRVLVYQKGIRLIEDILKKKAGRRNGRNRTTS